MWREQVEFLSARRYRVLAPDLRGLGENRFEGDIATMEEMARDVVALMDESNVEDAVICALSMGCYVAFELVHMAPARVRALVLAGGRAEGADKAEKHSREQQARRVLARGLAPSVDNILESLLSRRTLTEKPDVVAHVRRMVSNTDPRGAAAAQRGMAARRDYRDDLHEITAPTLIIAGREDGVRKPIDADVIHRGIRNSRVETIAEAGHLMNMEQPEKFNQLLIEFLNGLSQ